MRHNKSIDLHRLYLNDEIINSPDLLAKSQPIVELNKINIKKTSDVYEHACNITGWQQLYNQILPGQFNGSVIEGWLEGIQFFKEYTSKMVQQKCMVWPGAVWIGIPLLCNPQMGRIEHSPLVDDLVGIQIGGTEFGLNTPEDYTIFGLVIDIELLESYFETILHRTFPIQELSKQMTIRISREEKANLCHLINTALNIAYTSPEILNNHMTIKTLRYNLLEAIDGLFTNINSVNHPYIILKKSQQNHMHITQKAHEFIMDNAQSADDINIVEICEHLKTSRRTLQNAFQSVWGVSPIAYLKAIKLNAVRRELRSPYSQFSTVQDAAMSWGFWHMGQFSLDYQTLFKELPSQTLSNRLVFQ